MKMASAAIALTLLALSRTVTAEVLHGVTPLSILAEVKEQYPNAKFTRESAAWVQEWQAFYSMTGSGFPGKLYLTFNDSRPYWRGEYERLSAESSTATDSFTSIKTKVAGQLAQRTEDQALEIQWVRWIPDQPIPMTRVKGKYGPPEKCGFSDDDFTPYCSWPSRALSAMTSDDHKFVIFLTAGFTDAEKRAAYKKRGLTPPPDLIEKPASRSGK